MRGLDLFCGAGGASRGYSDAGFDMVGVDNRYQPRYPFFFSQGDALHALETLLAGRYITAEDQHYGLDDFDFIHASPPCEHYATVTAWRGDQDNHPDLIAPTRELLELTGLPWVLENVPEAPVRADFLLCGTAFGLRVRRHRTFETNWSGTALAYGCQHRPSDYAFDHGGKQPESVYRDAMGVGWMTVAESRDAIPPAYTQFIGEQLRVLSPWLVEQRAAGESG